MPHPLVDQLRFTRSELKRALAGVSEDDASRRLLPMNCISWAVGHLAAQEQRSWLIRGQGYVLRPALNDQFVFGAPAITPALAAMWDAWHAITTAADPWLDTLTTADLTEQRPVDKYGRPGYVTYGTMLQRVIYHYWYHLGEAMAVRQQLGHTDLPAFVGNIDAAAPYRPA